MVPWDFGSPSPRAKLVSYVHGYTCTSKDWFLLLFIQNSLHSNKVVCMKHHFCLYSDCSRLFQQELSGQYPPVTIETETYLYPLIKAVTIETGTSFVPSTQGCYPPVTIETRSSVLPSTQGCYPPVTIETRSSVLPST